MNVWLVCVTFDLTVVMCDYHMITHDLVLVYLRAKVYGETREKESVSTLTLTI